MLLAILGNVNGVPRRFLQQERFCKVFPDTAQPTGSYSASAFFMRASPGFVPRGTDVELEPTETCGISESLANLQPQRLDISLLSEQHEQAVDDWLKTHDIDYANAVGPKSRFLNSVQAAASRGDAEAKYLLGLTYSDGFGVVAQDLDKSTRLLTEAADAGNPKAQCTLGILYCLGYNVEKNPCAGRMWLDRSAQHGNEVARRALRLIKPEYDQR